MYMYESLFVINQWQQKKTNGIVRFRSDALFNANNDSMWIKLELLQTFLLRNSSVLFIYLNFLLWLWIPADQVEGDLQAQKLVVTSDKPQEELLAALKKTGKNVEYIGIASLF